MPQYLRVAVVATDQESFESVAHHEAFRKVGIAPRYVPVVLGHAASQPLTALSAIDPETIGLWVALDDAAYLACQELHATVASRPGYSRGFYDQYLPDAVLRIEGAQQFNACTAKVWEAFCASS